MKIRVVHTVNGTTLNDYFTAYRISSTIIPGGHGAAKIELYSKRNKKIGWKLYAHCETIEPVDG